MDPWDSQWEEGTSLEWRGEKSKSSSQIPQTWEGPCDEHKSL